MISIQDFEIRKTPALKDDVINLEFYINQSNFITFPFYIKNIENEITDKFKQVLAGKEVVINLSLDSGSSKLFQITKSYSLINVLRKDEGLSEEIYLKLENNSIFRNALRQFIQFP
jgi:hypothetical protein